MSVSEGESQISVCRTRLQSPPPAFQFCYIFPCRLFYMNFTLLSFSICSKSLLYLSVCFNSLLCFGSFMCQLSFQALLLYSDTALICYCTHPVESERKGKEERVVFHISSSCPVKQMDPLANSAHVSILC